MPSGPLVRGVIEGFYGAPWPHDARLSVIEFAGERGLNAYVYAPKSDPRHRARWREPYDEVDLAHFRDLVARGDACGVRFGFAISPGLDIDYGDDADRAALQRKLAPLLDAGVTWFVLALDDIEMRGGLAGDQVALVGWLLGALRKRRTDLDLTLVPTEYVGTQPSPYLGMLAAGLPPDVEVMWTGPTVCSPVITAAQARSWAAALGGRKPLLWDNYPVNDGPMERSVHLGPYRGREAALASEVSGVLCNPMVQPNASKVALATAADWLDDPPGYDPEAAWARAIADVGGVHAAELSALASACADSPVQRPEHLEAHRLLDNLTAGAAAGVPRALRDHLDAVRQAGRRWPQADGELRAELDPWLAQGRLEGDAGVAALGLLDAVDGEVSADTALLHVFGLLLAWSAARAGADRVVFGPRFGVYPAVVQLARGGPGIDVDLALVENRSAVDRLCRVALDAYRRWSKTG